MGKKWISEIMILPEPVRLRGQVPVQDVAFFVLETPGDHDKDVPLPDPCPFLDLAFDPAHTFDTVKTAHADMVCPQHQPGACKLFAVLLPRQPHTDDRRPVSIVLSDSISTRFFCGVPN